MFVLFLSSTAAIGPAAAEPEGAPTLATFELIGLTARDSSNEKSKVALSTFAEDGKSLKRLLIGSLESKGFSTDFLGGISFSPDGAQIAFTAEARIEDPASRAIYVINADGTGLRRLPGTRRGAEPLFAPDGATLAFTRSKFRSPKIDLEKLPPIRGEGYSSTTTWLLDIATGKARRLTPWRNRLSVTPGSFSPDGTTLALTRTDARRKSLAILLRPLAGGPTRLLTKLGEDPDFSPDGTHVVFVGYRHPVHVEAEEDQSYFIGDLYSIGVDGKDLRRLTDNEAIETSPAWDPSGTRIAFVEADPDNSWLPGLANLFASGNRIRQMNADGSCQKTIRSVAKVALFGVAWQPGEPSGGHVNC